MELLTQSRLDHRGARDVVQTLANDTHRMCSAWIPVRVGVEGVPCAGDARRRTIAGWAATERASESPR
jgi:hypothetical protein